MYFMRTYCFCY